MSTSPPTETLQSETKRKKMEKSKGKSRSPKASEWMQLWVNARKNQDTMRRSQQVLRDMERYGKRKNRRLFKWYRIEQEGKTGKLQLAKKT
jgi:hypothetical protein